MRKEIDKNIVRKLMIHEADAPPLDCPQCGALLVQDWGPYLVATRHGRQLTDEFVMRGPFGYLCPECPTAVIHMPDLSDMLYNAPLKPGWEAGPEFAVVGLVNLDAVPPDKADASIEDLLPQVFVPFEQGENETAAPIDTSIQRTLYFTADDTLPENCPECGRPLVLDYGPYLVRKVYQGQDDVEIVIEGPFAYLCPECPTAVIYVPELVEGLEEDPEDSSGDMTLTILGRFNLEDMPPEQIPDNLGALPPESLVLYPHARHPYRRRKRRLRKKRPRKPKPKRRKKRR